MRFVDRCFGVDLFQHEAGDGAGVFQTRLRLQEGVPAH